jgi:hypothetical protein|tara:strand:+ start:237 stop:434 length:198 start_codon:yes stop_codon:yes gene_type:complete
MSESDRVVSFAQSHMCMGCFEVVRVSVLKVREWVSFHMNPEIQLDGVCPKCGFDSKWGYTPKQEG